LFEVGDVVRVRKGETKWGTSPNDIIEISNCVGRIKRIEYDIYWIDWIKPPKDIILLGEHACYASSRFEKIENEDELLSYLI